ncbi:Quinone oxidoreductase [Hypsibius exemplaris]|uniref:Quinone oxidoreductase n=1 Tax=Hypsibius exemplaris TaxID=2072580 RepID=A0A1W0WXZ2_HYPEX|nr:Quinone oxidoreductase [Hypsibius exemplaris]
MQAIRVSKYGGPEELRLETVPIPTPSAKQILIQVKAVGVNPVETYVRAGAQLPFNPVLTYTPGSDAAGVVAAIGAEITNVKVGDRVYTCETRHLTGAYAQYMLAPPSKVFLLPDRLSFSQGAALGIPYFTVIRALKQARWKSGQRVLIHGASGGVGLAACQVAKAWGLDVVGTAGTDEGLALVKSAGARVVLNHRDPHHAANLKNAADGKGFDIILEMQASTNLPLDIDVVAPFGTVVIIGNRGEVPINPGAIVGKESFITAVLLLLATDEDFVEMGAQLAEGLKAGYIDPIIDQEFPLERAPEAHKAIMDASAGSKGKIVLLP